LSFDDETVCRSAGALRTSSWALKRTGDDYLTL
jgi:hypothetical protein